MANRQKSKIVTRKHIAREQQDKIQTRNLVIVFSIILTAVFGLIGYGIVDELLLTPRKAVAIVGGDTITAGEFEARAKYERVQIINEYGNTLDLMESFADESTRSYFENRLNQINFDLNPITLGQSVMDTLVNEIVIRQGAAELGITVNPVEVEEVIQSAFGYFPSGTPTTQPLIIAGPTSTLSAFQRSLFPPTATPETLVVTDTQAISATQVVVPTEIVPTDIPPTAVPTDAVVAPPTPLPLPTATPYSEEMYINNFQSVLDNLGDAIGFSEVDFRRVFETELIRQRLIDYLTADVEAEEDQIWARHILVDDEDSAAEVVERLIDGDEFFQLAQELSTDAGSGANGGDLGWFGRGQMVAEFEESAYSLEVGEISPPIQSGFGWHIIQVLGRENRSLDQEAYDQRIEIIFTEWLTEALENTDVEILEYGEYVPSEPSIPQELLPQQQQPLPTP